jgi:hypothetical protein
VKRRLNDNMITGKEEELKDIAKNYVCKEEGGHLTVAWQGISTKEEGGYKLFGRWATPEEEKDGGCYVLRCQHEHIPEEVTRQPTLTEMYNQGETLPGWVEDNVKKGIEKRAARLPGAPQAMPLTGIPTTDLGTEELLPQSAIYALTIYAQKYKLDPARGHVCLMYGKPYITIDGYLFHAKKSGVEFSLYTKPLDDAEKKLYQIPEGAHAWLSTVQFAGEDNYCTGIGIVTREELTEKSKKNPAQLASPAVARHPWQLAQKRGEWQALRRAFPIGETKEGDESNSTKVGGEHDT